MIAIILGIVSDVHCVFLQGRQDFFREKSLVILVTLARAYSQNTVLRIHILDSEPQTFGEPETASADHFSYHPVWMLHAP